MVRFVTSPAPSPKSSPVNSNRASDTVGLDDFSLRGALGIGGTSQVLLVQRKGMAGYFALKVVPKTGMDKSQVQQVVNENQMMRRLSHPYIVRLVSAFQDMAHFFLLLDYKGSGDLAMHLQVHGTTSEDDARLVLGSTVLALRYLHGQSIIYRDLKPENILLDHTDRLPVLADFGTAKHMSAAVSTHTCIGTPLYMAPEQYNVSQAGYQFGVDWWAAGVILYEMICGDVPWDEGGCYKHPTEVASVDDPDDPIAAIEDELASRMRMLGARLNAFELGSLPRHMSHDAQDLVRGLLQANPAARLGGGPDGGPDGGAKVAAHAFFASLDWDALLRRQLPSTLGKADSEPALSDGESQHVAAEFRSFDVGQDTSSPPIQRLGSPRTLGRSSPRNEASRSPSNGPGGRRLPPSAAVPSFTVSEDCRIWAISFELSRILGLDSSATRAPHLLLGRSARAILLPPYHKVFEGALENVLRAHAGGAAADELSSSQSVSIGVAGSSGASLMLHGSLHVATVEPGDVSNLFASSAHLAVKTLVRFAADKCTLLASVNPLSGLTPRGWNGGRTAGAADDAAPPSPAGGRGRALGSPKGSSAPFPVVSTLLDGSSSGGGGSSPDRSTLLGGASAADEWGEEPVGREAIMGNVGMVDFSSRSALLHQVQRERGVSCGFLSSIGAIEYFDVPTFRSRTDSTNQTDMYVDQLTSVRTLVDTSIDEIRSQESSDPAALANSFYNAFRSYSDICNDLLSAQEVMLAVHDEDATRTHDPINQTMCVFSRFKESVARQRAFLCGALALPDEAIPVFSTRAFADLVVCVHEQRAYEQQLEDSSPAALRALIRPGLRKPPQLAKVQEVLEAEFDVMAVRAILTVQECWEVHSEHVDTLRRLEILLGNEVLRSSEIFAHQRMTADAALRIACSAIASGKDPLNASTAFEQLLQVPSTVVKNALLAKLDQLRTGAQTPRPTHQTRSTPGVMIKLEELRLEKRIGEGGTGTTYRGTYHRRQVAIKVAAVGGVSLSHWRHEIAVLTHIRHSNIVRYFGAVASPPTFCLVLEYCQQGDLRAALERPTSPGFFLQMAAGICSGMLCLHANGLIHRDLKSPNVLIDDHGTAKLADFGLALKDHGGLASPRDSGGRTDAGSFRWMAPEVARRLGYNRAADVYSMGMVLFELLTHELPFADVEALHAVAIVAVHGGRPPLPSGTPEAFAQLITQCWSEEPSTRPTFEGIERSLSAAHASLTPAELEWLDEPRGHRVYQLAS